MKKTIGLIVLLAVFGVLAPTPAFCQGAKVAVYPFRNNGQPQYNGLSSGLSAMLTTDLTKTESLEVIETLKVAEALGRARLVGGAPAVEDALKAAASLQADYAITGEFVVFGNKFRIDARLYDVRTGALKAAEKVQAKEDELFDMVDSLSAKLVLDITGVMPVIPGGLQVATEPPGASLTVDGDKAGETPAVLKGLSPGQHRIELSLDGYKTHSQTVTVKENDTVKVEVKLIRLFGGIRVWWKDFPTSDVSVAGETIKVSQFQANLFAKYCKNLPAGSYTVSVRMPYKDESAWENTRAWRTYNTDLEINPGDVVDIFLNNDLHGPGVEVSVCGPCADNWDFNTDIVWYEAQ